MADEKKYKYTVKKFAKMLTVHPDKRVTFQDTVDLRKFVDSKPLRAGMRFDNLTDLAEAAVALDDEQLTAAEISDYWPNLVEAGDCLINPAAGYDPPPLTIVSVENRFSVRVEYEVPPNNLARWLAETGFPQMSRAKEEPNADTPVAE